MVGGIGDVDMVQAAGLQHLKAVSDQNTILWKSLWIPLEERRRNHRCG